MSRLWILGWVLALVGCGGGSNADASRTVRYAKTTGTLSCEASRLKSADRQSALTALRGAGVDVKVMGCGHDGLVRTAVCGIENGELLWVEVASASAPLMSTLGYQPWASWPQAREMPCPPE